MSQFRAALLDVDGTLVDSNDAHARAWVDALMEHGFDVEFATVRPLIGMGGDKLLPHVSAVDAESHQGKRIIELRTKLFLSKYLPKVQPFPLVRELLQQLRTAGFRLVIATSASKEELDGLLKVCGAEELVDEITTSDDAEESKPDPDIIHAAIRKSGLPPDQNVLLGDTPYDVAAAARAGIATIAFRCGGWNDETLAGAIAIYDGPADLLEHFASSPLS